jgi:hypothetical protein
MAYKDLEKKKVTDAAYRKSHMGEAAAKSRAWYAAHKEEAAAKARVRRAAQTEEAKERARARNAARMLIRYARHKDEINARRAAQRKAKGKEARRGEQLMRDYDLTLEQYKSLLDKQGGRCAICGTDDSGRTDWNVDHCHVSGMVRGILCSPCNKGLGQFNDSPEQLRLAAEYLERHRDPPAASQ